MNATPFNTTDYENKRNWTLGQNKPNFTDINYAQGEAIK